MKQNHSRKHNTKNLKKDAAVSSVVSEMLLLAIGVVLVAVFAVSLMNVLPGDRDDYVDVVMRADAAADTIEFWHKGGDPISNASLRVMVSNMSHPEIMHTFTAQNLTITNSTGVRTNLFDIGACCNLTVPGLAKGDQVRLVTEKTIIYSGEVQ